MSDAITLGRRLLTDEEFNELLRLQVKHDETYISSKKVEGFIPQLLIYDAVKDEQGDRKAIITVIALDEFNEDKHKIMMGLGAKIAMEQPEFKPAAIVLTTEAWMRQPKDDEEMNSDKKISEYDDKIEALVTVGLSVDMRANMAMRKITRGSDNTIFLTGKVDYQDFNGKNEVQPFLLQRFYQGYAMAVVKMAEGEQK